jgi:hypothetical protein
MKPCFRYGVFFFVVGCALSSFAIDETPLPSRISSDESDYIPEMEDMSAFQHYKTLKKALKLAIREQDISTIAVIYLITKTYETYGKTSASISGVVAGASIMLLPITLGLSTVLLVPSAAVCAGMSIGTHRYRRLRNNAKNQLSRMLPPNVLAEISSLNDFSEGVSALHNILAKQGYPMKWSIQNR